MKQVFVGDNGNNRRLILIFAGWGMDAGVFSDISVSGYDIMVVWDYRDKAFDFSAMSRYSEVYVFAWSFGVFIASLVMNEFDGVPVMLRVAINGSMTPVNDETGIPEMIFQGTLSGLNDRSLVKFYRRVCDGSDDYQKFARQVPDRGIEELREELMRIYEMSRDAKLPDVVWDRVVISDNDRIFSPANLDKAWSVLPRVRHIPGGHYVDFQKIIEQEIIDKELVSARFCRSAGTYDGSALVQRMMAERLWKLSFPHISAGSPLLLEIGYGTGMLTYLYKEKLLDADVTLWDLAPQKVDFPATIVAGDAEQLIAECAEDSFEIIFSASTVQWFNNLPRFISLAASKLKCGGIMAISTFGPENLKEITAITRLPLRYYTLDELRRMVPGYCTVIELEQEKKVIEFRSPREIMLHLKNTGVNALKHVSLGYSELAAKFPRENGRCRLTYHPQYIVIKRNEK